MEQIGVRELRQHASRYLARVEGGETIEVTDRGRPVARLVPLRHDPWSDLIASGRLVLATDEDDLTEEGPEDYGVAASDRLREMRDESP